jgi:hypothetical protein
MFFIVMPPRPSGPQEAENLRDAHSYTKKIESKQRTKKFFAVVSQYSITMLFLNENFH